MSDARIEPPVRPFACEMSPPGSKSISNRALVLASMASGESTLRNLLLAEDTRVMLDSLDRLGYRLRLDESARTVGIAGGDIARDHAELFCGNSGTTLRFLAAAVARGQGLYRLDGVERMRQRPVGELGAMLRNLGVRLAYERVEGFPPLAIRADGLPGGNLRVGSAQSSQYLSAILMVAAFARHEVRIDLEGRQASWPYVAMTMRLMDDFGRLVELERDPDSGRPTRIVVPRGPYVPRSFTIEPDASNASYFLALAALHEGSEVTVRGLSRSSVQGDVGLADLLADMGAIVSFGGDFIRVRGSGRLRGIDVDLAETPDIAQTLAVAAIFASGSTRLRGLQSLRIKETDRVAALHAELTRLGVPVEIEQSDSDLALVITPARPRPAEIQTYDDHRMAMSFALAATRCPGITIRDAHCCGKTYPEFFTDLQRVLAGDGAITRADGVGGARS